MTDKEYDALSSRVEKIATEWRSIIGLSDHRIRYKFVREYHTEGNTVAEALPLWQYKHHTLKFYMPTVAECESDGELEEDILHELVHILLAPGLGNEPPSNDAEAKTHEFTVQSVTYALIWAKEAGAKDASREVK